MLENIELFSQLNPNEAINNVYELLIIEKVVGYLNGAAGFPTKATWLRSIRAGNYLTWPLINVKNVYKYFLESEETQKGHRRNQRQGVWSTKNVLTPNLAALCPVMSAAHPAESVSGENSIHLPTVAGDAAHSLMPVAVEGQEKLIHTPTEARGTAHFSENGDKSLQKTHHDAGGPSKSVEPGPTVLIEKKRDVLITLYEPKATLFADQTGRFPQQSSRGNNYQMIHHNIDSNSTWVEPMKNRTEGKMILVRRRALAQMKLQQIVPTHQVLDNEISKAYKTEIQATSMTYQLVPPDDHRCNMAEKTIQTWKDHFVGVLSGTSDTFPLHLWCQALPQMERQLLLLWQSNTNPKVSAYAHVYGQHNYNAAPFVPIGMKTLVHEKPHWQKSFAKHCKKGCVLGT
jgi:hypothetical protein